MKTIRITRPIVLASLVALMVPIVLFTPKAYAESYVAGQIGLSVPSIGKGLSKGELNSTNSTSTTSPSGTLTFPSGTELSDQSLKSSLLLGVKFGHFFSKARWLGIETELFRTTPHIKQQNLTFTSGSGGPITFTPTAPGPSSNISELTSVGAPGLNFRVITWAPMNVVFRYPGQRLQPYIAIGPGIFFARLRDSSITSGPDSQSSTKIGLNTQLGLRYYMTRNVSMFGEWKYNYTRFNFQENDNFIGFRATYSMHHFAFGIGYHF